MTLTDFASTWIENYKSIKLMQSLRSNPTVIIQLKDAVEKNTIGLDTLIDVDFFENPENSPHAITAFKMTLFNYTEKQAKAQYFHCKKIPDDFITPGTRNISLSSFIFYVLNQNYYQVEPIIKNASPNIKNDLLVDAIKFSRETQGLDFSRQLIHMYGYAKASVVSLNSLWGSEKIKIFCQNTLKEAAEKWIASEERERERERERARIKVYGDEEVHKRAEEKRRQEREEERVPFRNLHETIHTMSILNDNSVFIETNFDKIFSSVSKWVSQNRNTSLISAFKESFRNAEGLVVFNNLMKIDFKRYEAITDILKPHRIPLNHVSAHLILKYCIDPDPKLTNEQVKHFLAVTEVLRDTLLLSTADQEINDRTLKD